jgi:hypothetical protein
VPPRKRGFVESGMGSPLGALVAGEPRLRVRCVVRSHGTARRAKRFKHAGFGALAVGSPGFFFVKAGEPPKEEHLVLTPEALNRAEEKTRHYDDRVLTFQEWCVLNSLSPATARRILKSGAGPTSVQLSPRRIGITMRANREWLAKRAR